MHGNVGKARLSWISTHSVRVVLLGMIAALLSSVASPVQPARAADPVCTVSAKLVNSCRPWVGAESGGYVSGGFRAMMLEHEARIGRQLDIVHEYLGVNAVLPSDVVTLARRPGTIALVNWRVANRWRDGDGRSATLNLQIDAMANSIKALGSTKIMLTLHHEPENDISPGGEPSCPTTTFVGSSGATADYVNMWHNVRARFNALGVSNVVWVMNYMGWKAWNCVVKPLWPGNEYVDWVMWDPYPKTATWTAFVNLFYNFMLANSDATHDFLSKPWGLAEFGYVGSSQTAAYAMYDEARRNLQNGVYPRIKAYVVWDNHTSSSHDDRVGYSETGVKDATEQAHYNAFVNDPLLTGEGVPEPTDQTPPTVVAAAPEDGTTVEGTVSVTGSASDDVGVEAVDLLVDGAVVSTTPGTGGPVSFGWNSTTVANGTHTLQLRASDEAGNTGLSDEVSVTVLNPADDEAPTPPSLLTATWSRPSKVTLTWSGSSDNAAVAGYRVYRDNGVIANLGPGERSHADVGVANLTTHVYHVTALDAADNESDPSETMSVDTGDDTAPTAPVTTAELTAPDEATVTWSESTDNAAVVGYRVYRNGALVADVTDGNRTVVDDALDDGVVYSYRVSAYDAAGNTGPLSSAATVTTPDTTAPSVPGSLQAVSGSQSVALTWTASTDNVAVASYLVYRDGLLRATLGGTATGYTDNALVGATLHRYRVLAQDAAGNESAQSNEVARSLSDTTAPSAPTGLTGSRSGFTVRLVWTASTDNVGVQSYTIYRGGVAIGTSTTPAYTDSTPPLGRSSSYSVRARDAAGNVSGASNTVTVAIPADTSAPTSPSGLRATAGASGTRQIALTWNASTDNVGVNSYYLFRGNAKYLLLGRVTSYTDTGLVAGTTYTYKVYAIDASGNWSGPSGKASATAR